MNRDVEVCIITMFSKHTPNVFYSYKDDTQKFAINA